MDQGGNTLIFTRGKTKPIGLAVSSDMSCATKESKGGHSVDVSRERVNYGVICFQRLGLTLGHSK